MDVLTAIADRRAIRAYRDEKVDRETVRRLVDAAVQAPSAMDLEPWAFLVFEGASRLSRFSKEAKAHRLASAADLPPDARRLLADPSFDVFYGAPLLLVICATSAQSQAAEDCCLAAQNLMLAAHAEGLATCPIGFARPWLNLPATRRELGIPPALVPVFPLILGHPGEHPARRGRRAPEIHWL
ncbi:MAG: nitroreductase family protein [Acidobacteriota bacterium]